MKRLALIGLIFLISVPLVFAADFSNITDAANTTTKIVYEGNTTLTTALSVKSAAEKPAILANATNTALKAEKFPYTVTKSTTNITLDKYRCEPEICWYWITATRDGKSVQTNSPIGISPPPYLKLVSETYDEKANEITVTLKEDPKGAMEQTLQQYVDMQPLGDATVGTKE